MSRIGMAWRGMTINIFGQYAPACFLRGSRRGIGATSLAAKINGIGNCEIGVDDVLDDGRAANDPGVRAAR